MQSFAVQSLDTDLVWQLLALWGVTPDVHSSHVTLLHFRTESQLNHHTTSGGICFLGDPWRETVTSAGKEISWADIGIKIIIPPGVIPEGKPITVSVRPCLSGPFELPEDYELASPVYAISPELEFSKDVKLFIAHFADLQSEDDCKNMTFLTTQLSSLPGDSHPYRLLVQKNGNFQRGSREGEISLRHFSKKAIGKKRKQDGNQPGASANQSKGMSYLKIIVHLYTSYIENLHL